MQVPGADYSPIATANRAKTTALQTAYQAKSASKWKERNETNEKMMALNQESLNLQKWQTTVNTVLGVVDGAISLGQSIYNLKENKDKEEADLKFTEWQRKVNQSFITNGPDITYDDDTNLPNKPQALIDLEQELFDEIDNSSWTSGVKTAAKSSLTQMFSNAETSYIASAVERTNEATLELFNMNLNNALSNDIAAGGDSPTSAIALINGNTMLSSAEKELQVQKVTTSFHQSQINNEITRRVSEEGYKSATDYIDSLPDGEGLWGLSKEELKKDARGALTEVTAQATTIGSSEMSSLTAGTRVELRDANGNATGEYTNYVTPKSVKNYWDTFDETHANMSPESKEAVRVGALSAQQSWLESKFETDFANASSTWTGLVNYGTRLENVEADYYTGLESLHDSHIAKVNEQISSIETITGSAAKDSTKNAVYNYKMEWRGGTRSWDSFVDEVTKLQADFTNDSEMSKFFMDELENSYKEHNGTVDSIAKPVLETIRMNMELTSETLKKLSPEVRTKLVTMDADVYKDIGDLIAKYPGGIDSQLFAEELRSYIALYNNEYIKLLEMDPNTSSVLDPTEDKALEYIQNTFSKGYVELTGEATEAGLVEVRAINSSIQADWNSAVDRLGQHYRINQDLGIDPGTPGFVAKDGDGKLYIAFKDGKNDGNIGFYFFDINDGKLLNTTPASSVDSIPKAPTYNTAGNLESTMESYDNYSLPESLSEKNPETAVQMLASGIKTVQNNAYLDKDSIDWEYLTTNYTRGNILKIIENNKDLQPYEISIMRAFDAYKTGSNK